MITATYAENVDTIYNRLSDWTSVVPMQERLKAYFLARSRDEIPDYREKKGKQKRLRDEVVPVFHHFKVTGFKGEVKFMFDNHAPDCWLRTDPCDEPIGIEVTVALSREAALRGRELNIKGEGRGFVGILDNLPKVKAEARMAAPRRMYSTDAALRTTQTAIEQCLAKKDKPKYAGFHLLIEAPLNSVARERWSGVFQNLRSIAAELPFDQIHLISDRDGPLFGHQIK